MEEGHGNGVHSEEHDKDIVEAGRRMVCEEIVAAPGHDVDIGTESDEGDEPIINAPVISLAGLNLNRQNGARRGIIRRPSMVATGADNHSSNSRRGSLLPSSLEDFIDGQSRNNQSGGSRSLGENVKKSFLSAIHPGLLGQGYQPPSGHPSRRASIAFDTGELPRAGVATKAAWLENAMRRTSSNENTISTSSSQRGSYAGVLETSHHKGRHMAIKDILTQGHVQKQSITDSNDLLKQAFRRTSIMGVAPSRSTSRNEGRRQDKWDEMQDFTGSVIKDVPSALIRANQTDATAAQAHQNILTTSILSAAKKASLQLKLTGQLSTDTEETAKLEKMEKEVVDTARKSIAEIRTLNALIQGQSEFNQDSQKTLQSMLVQSFAIEISHIQNFEGKAREEFSCAAARFAERDFFNARKRLKGARKCMEIADKLGKHLQSLSRNILEKFSDVECDLPDLPEWSGNLLQLNDRKLTRLLVSIKEQEERERRFHAKGGVGIPPDDSEHEDDVEDVANDDEGEGVHAKGGCIVKEPLCSGAHCEGGPQGGRIAKEPEKELPGNVPAVVPATHITIEDIAKMRSERNVLKKFIPGGALNELLVGHEASAFFREADAEEGEARQGEARQHIEKAKALPGRKSTGLQRQRRASDQSVAKVSKEWVPKKTRANSWRGPALDTRHEAQRNADVLHESNLLLMRQVTPELESSARMACVGGLGSVSVLLHGRAATANTRSSVSRASRGSEQASTLQLADHFESPCIPPPPPPFLLKRDARSRCIAKAGNYDLATFFAAIADSPSNLAPSNYGSFIPSPTSKSSHLRPVRAQSKMDDNLVDPTWEIFRNSTTSPKSAPARNQYAPLHLTVGEFPTGGGARQAGAAPHGSSKVKSGQTFSNRSAHQRWNVTESASTMDMVVDNYGGILSKEAAKRETGPGWQQHFNQAAREKPGTQPGRRRSLHDPSVGVWPSAVSRSAAATPHSSKHFMGEVPRGFRANTAVDNVGESRSSRVLGPGEVEMFVSVERGGRPATRERLAEIQGSLLVATSRDDDDWVAPFKELERGLTPKLVPERERGALTRRGVVNPK